MLPNTVQAYNFIEYFGLHGPDVFPASVKVLPMVVGKRDRRMGNMHVNP